MEKNKAFKLMSELTSLKFDEIKLLRKKDKEYNLEIRDVCFILLQLKEIISLAKKYEVDLDITASLIEDRKVELVLK